jgi:hypothetical protein
VAEDTPGSILAEAAELEGVARRRGHGPFSAGGALDEA